MAIEKQGKVDGKHGRWVFEEETSEEERMRQEIMVMECLSFTAAMAPDFRTRCGTAESFQDYFPGDNGVPPDGAWVMVRKPPMTEYTVPHFSVWFATPWPFNSHRAATKRQTMPPVQRIRIVTPKGDLGLFPHEYTLIGEPSKYYEFFGEGMQVRFFGSNTEGVPELPLFYLRSRGVGKADAIAMLIGQIKAHGVCWIEVDKDVARTFVRDYEWPAEERLATIIQPKQKALR